MDVINGLMQGFDTALQATHTRRERRRRSCGVGPAAGRFLRVKINDRHLPPARQGDERSGHERDADHVGQAHLAGVAVDIDQKPPMTIPMSALPSI